MISSVTKLLAILAIMAWSLSAYSAQEPIYINLTTKDSSSVLKALDAGKQYSVKGFPLVIFLNDQAVSLAVVAHSKDASIEQKALEDAINNGAIVYICQGCLESAGLSGAKLIPGLKKASPSH